MSEPKFVIASVQFSEELLKEVDDRAQQLDLNRSQYLRKLVREDLRLAALALPAPPPVPQEVAA
jgi:metal-responsive CopG/Arc/MetJ family transcriptional regulator